MPETTPAPATDDPAERPPADESADAPPTDRADLPTDRADLPTTVDGPRLARVYLHLARTGGGSVEGVAAALDLRPHALVPVLTLLDRRGAVERVDGEYVARPPGEAG